MVASSNTAPTFAAGGLTHTSSITGYQSGAPAGDVDGDGVGDIIVGSLAESSGGLTANGAAYVVSGATGAVLLTLRGDGSDDRFGFSVAGIGDVNGDGRADLAVGARDDDNVISNSGSVRVVSGRDGTTLFTLNGENFGSYFGLSLAALGDVDGDGKGDFVVGAPLSNATGAQAGMARVVSGATGATLLTVRGEPGDYLGYSVSAMGDVDGDGRGDFVVGLMADDTAAGADSGSVRVISSATGATLLSVNGESAGDQFGWSVAGLGDVNGDGKADFIVGARKDDTNGLTDNGTARVISGADGSTLFTVSGVANSNELGRSVGAAGDVDGDGRADFVVGNPWEKTQGYWIDAGAARVYSGATGALIHTASGAAFGASVGQFVGTAGDLDGDGRSDVLIGVGGENATRVLTTSSLNNRPVYAELGAAVVLDGDADIRDAELDAADNYAGATLTLARLGGAVAADVFGTTGTLAFVGSAVQLNGVTVGGVSNTGGVLAIAFNGAATSAAADEVLRQITYANSSYDPGTAARIAYTFNDGAAGDAKSATGLITVRVNTIDAPPTNTAPGPVAATEDVSRSISGLSIVDGDSPGVLTSRLSVTQGTLTVASVDGGAAVSGSGTGAVLLEGTQAQINATLASSNVLYRAVADFNGADVLTMVTSDGVASDTDAVSITVSEVNDAPVAVDDALADVAEDSGLRTISFSSLLANDATGPAAESGQTLALTSVSNAIGGQVAIVEGAVRFVPDADYNGAAGFDYVVTDNGTTDGAAAPLTDAGRVSFNITSVQDAPTNTVPGALTVDEDANLSVTGLSVTDGDGGSLTTTLAVAEGTLTVAAVSGGAHAAGSGGRSVTLTGTIAQINTTLAATNGVVYRGLADDAGADTLTVTTSDGTTSDVDTVAITVTSVNDVPVMSPVNQFARFNGAGYMDVSAPPAFTGTGAYTYEVSFRADPASGFRTLIEVGVQSTNIGAGFAIGPSGKLDYGVNNVFAMQTPGAVTDGAWHRVAATYDGAGTHRFYLDGVLVGTQTGVSPNLQGGLALIGASSNASFSNKLVGDIDEVKIWTVARTAEQIAGVDAGPQVGTEQGLIGYYTFDGASAGTNRAAGLAHGALVGGVTRVAAPEPAFTEVAGVTDGATTHQASGALSFVDADHADTHTHTVAAPVITLSGGGAVPEALRDGLSTALSTTLTDSTGDGSGEIAYTFSLADDLLDILPAGEMLQALYTVTVEDASGGRSTRDLIITVTGTNDAPLITSTPDVRPVFTEDGAAVILDGAAAIADVELDAADSYAGATLTLSRQSGAAAEDLFAGSGLLSFAAGGALLLDEVEMGAFTNTGGRLSITFNSTATTARVNEVLRAITYANASDTPPASVTIAYSFGDGAGGTAPGLIEVAITAVDDLPVNTVPASHTVSQDTDLSITGLAVADADSSSLEAILTVERGVLIVGTAPGGATVTGSGTGSVTLSGSAAAINAVLQLQGNVVYRPAAGYVGAAALTLTTGDASGQDQDEVTITVRLGDATQGDDLRTGGAEADVFDALGGNDTIKGMGGNDRLTGGTGADILNGGADDDWLDGGSGSDTASYAGATGAVAVSLSKATAQDTGGAGVDTLVRIENLTGSDHDDLLTGGTTANRLEGGGGKDHLRGALGDDKLYGESGDDLLNGGPGNDQLHGGDGIDTATYVSASSAGVKVSLATSAYQNTGGGGTDLLTGVENLIGSHYGDQLTGSAGANDLNGGQGDDVLKGGDGADTLTGFWGADRFVFTQISDSDGAELDRITDLETTDVIDLFYLDANGSASGNGAFVRIGNEAQFTSAGQLRLSQHGADTWLELNTDGDTDAEMIVLLTGDHTGANATDGWLL